MTTVICDLLPYGACTAAANSNSIFLRHLAESYLC